MPIESIGNRGRVARGTRDASFGGVARRVRSVRVRKGGFSHGGQCGRACDGKRDAAACGRRHAFCLRAVRVGGSGMRRIADARCPLRRRRAATIRGLAAAAAQRIHAACGRRPTGRGRCCYTCRHDETGTGALGAHRIRAGSHARAATRTRRRRNRVRARIRNHRLPRCGRRIGSGERASRSARGRAHRIVRTGCARDRAERTMRAGFIRGYGR